MKLFIAEKPKMGKAIAKSLPGPHVSKEGYVETGGGIVTWCIGHLLGTAPPPAYDPKYEAFPGKFDDLPIVPTNWKLEVSGDKGKQVSIIKGLLKTCTSVVNAGDPGREGQLIIDELLEYLNNKKPVYRIELNQLTDAAIKKELGNLKDNTLFRSLYQAGLGRQRADWLVGMNLSRAYTILGSSAGYRGVLSVGRVQSPTLAIAVRRDREIENFVPVSYWTVKAQFHADDKGKKAEFWANWAPPGSGASLESESDEEEADPSAAAGGAARPAWLDASNRIIDASAANAIAAKVKGQTGSVTQAIRKRVQEAQPLGFDLSALQIMGSAKWGASVSDTLAACQALYDQGLASYPRTDCSYMPEGQHAEAPGILAAISKTLPQLSGLASGATPSIKSRAWDDSKLGEHYAIIPTAQSADGSKLSALEQKVYEAICQRYIAQFYPAAEVDKAKLLIEVQDELFVARGRTIVDPGWRVVYGGEDGEAEDPAAKGAEEKDKADALLPELNQGDAALCHTVKVDAKQTTPPPQFDQGTLLRAMKQVHLLVTDPVMRKKLSAMEGIGRSATRAAIIETLLKRGFLETKGKKIISTQVGRALVDALPPKLIDPVLSAMWETALDSVAGGKASLEAFMAKQADFIQKLVDTAKTQTLTGLPQGPNPAWASSGKKPASGSGSKSSSSAKPKSASSGAAKAAPAGAKTCPKCKKGKLVEREIKNGPKAGQKFMGCTNYPDCK